MFDVLEIICLNCHHQGYRKSISPGSFIGELLLWIIFLFISAFTTFILLMIPVIYTMYRGLGKSKVCEKCESKEVIPLDSPKAKELLKSQVANDSKT